MSTCIIVDGYSAGQIMPTKVSLIPATTFKSRRPPALRAPGVCWRTCSPRSQALCVSSSSSSGKLEEAISWFLVRKLTSCTVKGSRGREWKCFLLLPGFQSWNISHPVALGYSQSPELATVWTHHLADVDVTSSRFATLDIFKDKII